jgi:hypothetical protein
MFLRKLRVVYTHHGGPTQLCPLAWIDNFAMRNFTNRAVFDDTLPVSDGQMEVGLRIPLDALTRSMEDWFRRKGYLHEGDSLVIQEITEER